MAKLKARGREEIFRVRSIQPGDRDGIAEAHFFRALMSDGNVLTRQVIHYTPAEIAKNYGTKSHDYGWTVKGRAKSGIGLEQLLKGYLAKGWELVSASPSHFSVHGDTITAHSQEPFIAEATAAKRKASITKSRARAETERTRKATDEDGPGFYVTNGYTSGYATSRTRIADHPKAFTTLEAAEEFAVRRLRHLTVEFDFRYLLPVAIIESPSRRDAEENTGHIWWIDGKPKGPPVDPRQVGFQF